MHLVTHREVERTPQDVDQLSVGLERVRLVSAPAARLDGRLDHLERSLPSWRQDDVLDPEAAEVHDLAVSLSYEARSGLLEQRSDPYTEQLADAQERRNRRVRLVSLEEADEPIREISCRGELGDRHPSGPPCRSQARPDPRRVNRRAHVTSRLVAHDGLRLHR